MSDTIVDVYHSHPRGDRLVGRLYGHRRRGVESATFAYAESWLSRSGAFELEPGLPLFAGSQHTPDGKALFGVFTDSSPDRWGQKLLTRREKHRAEREGTAQRSFGAMDYLVGVRDDVRQGALRYKFPDVDVYQADDHDGVPLLLELGKLLSLTDKVEREEVDDDDLRVLVRAGSSLGGARPKAHVLDVAGKLAIAKFPSPNDGEWDVMLWERVALVLAEKSGIRAPGSQLHDVAGRNVLVLDRFDRDGTTRIDYVSAMTMVEGVDGEQRSYLEIAEVIATTCLDVNRELEELWRRMAFSILITNTDDHMRNHGFVRGVDAAGWSLSPIFDVNPVPVGAPELSTAIDEQDVSADVDLLMGVAEWFRLRQDDALRVLGDVERATREWRTVAHQCGATPSEIEFMRPAFEHDRRERARSLVGA